MVLKAYEASSAVTAMRNSVKELNTAARKWLKVRSEIPIKHTFSYDPELQELRLSLHTHGGIKEDHKTLADMLSVLKKHFWKQAIGLGQLDFLLRIPQGRPVLYAHNTPEIGEQELAWVIKVKLKNW